MYFSDYPSCVSARLRSHLRAILSAGFDRQDIEQIEVGEAKDASSVEFRAALTPRTPLLPESFDGPSMLRPRTVRVQAASEERVRAK